MELPRVAVRQDALSGMGENLVANPAKKLFTAAIPPIIISNIVVLVMFS